MYDKKFIIDHIDRVANDPTADDIEAIRDELEQLLVEEVFPVRKRYVQLIDAYYRGTSPLPINSS